MNAAGQVEVAESWVESVQGYERGMLDQVSGQHGRFDRARSWQRLRWWRRLVAPAGRRGTRCSLAECQGGLTFWRV